jgi:two-component system sensor histidine kinase BaeS
VTSGIGGALALLLSWGLAERWLKPIRHLTAGADAIAQGRLDTQVPVLGHDELSRLAITFNAMAQRLQQAEQDHQHWLSDIAHELRTPLAAMRAEIEATLDGVRPLNPVTMQRLHKQILRLGQLVDDLRRSMNDTAASNPRDAGVRPLEVLLDTLALMQARLEQATLQVDASAVQALAGQTPITMVANAAQLHQVFSNIFENTLRYTQAGGQVRVSATLLRSHTQLRIRIEDSPPAPAVADMPRLFERLYRGENSRDRASGGSGLGLAICKHILEAHGGSIRADDSELGGLYLELLLPVKCDDVSPL